MSYSVEKVMRVYDDKEGVYIEVRQHPDAPDSGLEIHTTGNQACIDWYGEQRIVLNSREHRSCPGKGHHRNGGDDPMTEDKPESR